MLYGLNQVGVDLALEVLCGLDGGLLVDHVLKLLVHFEAVSGLLKRLGRLLLGLLFKVFCFEETFVVQNAFLPFKLALALHVGLYYALQF